MEEEFHQDVNTEINRFNVSGIALESQTSISVVNSNNNNNIYNRIIIIIMVSHFHYNTSATGEQKLEQTIIRFWYRWSTSVYRLVLSVSNLVQNPSLAR